MPDPYTYDVLIIGGGFAGLSAAALLSQQGKNVLLLERAGRLGGRASYYERDGFVWQYGQHSHRLATEGIAAALFRRLGLTLEFIDTSRDTPYLYSNGKLLPRPEGPIGFLRTRLLPVRARLNFIRFYARLLRLKPDDWYDKPLIDLYRTWFDNADVERFLSFLGFTVMIPDPAMVSAGEVIAFLQRAAKAKVKQGEPRGGCKQVIDKLAAATLEAGGRIQLGETVTEVAIEGGAAVGVRTAKKEYRAKSVVFAAPLFRLFDLVDPSLFSAAFVEYVRHIRPSSGFEIDFVSNEPLSDIRGGILGVDVPLWVKFQSNVDPALSPAGKCVSAWAMLLEPGQPPTKERQAAAEAHIRQIMDEILPGAAARVTEERRRFLPVVNANMLIPEQSYPHRPDIASEDVPNLFFIGDTTRGDGCSGDIAFSSAMKLADRLA